MANKLEIIGAIALIIGFLISVNSLENMANVTGNAISEGVYSSIGSFFGIFFILAGIFILFHGRNYEEKPIMRHGLK